MVIRRRAVAGLLGVCAVATVQLGCEHEPAAKTAFGAPEATPPGLLLRERSLGADAAADHQVLGEIWTTLSTIEGPEPAATALLQLASRQDDASLRDRAGARRLVIEAVVRTVQSGALGDRFEVLRGVVDRLYRAAPTAAETRFALGYLRWILLSDGRGGLRAGGVDASVVQDLIAQFETLLRDHPDFVGPAEFDAARLRRELAGVRALALPRVATPDDAGGA